MYIIGLVLLISEKWHATVQMFFNLIENWIEITSHLKN